MSDTHTTTDTHTPKTMSSPVEKFLSSKNIVEYTSFDEMGIPESLLRGIYSIGFERPSAIQRKAIVPVMAGVDVIAQAQSGTGKTGTFSIGSLARVDPAIKRRNVFS